ncbi:MULTISPECIES: hypothetical protein [Streptomyces]|uniref:hypothetical protein n=1 Tax=Streptomyces TaxID=1883 RepID=UPI00345BD4AB
MRAPSSAVPFPSEASSAGSSGASRRAGRAVVLGAGMAGLLAAAAVARHVGEA